MNTQTTFDRIAHQIAEHGTATEAHSLETFASHAASTRPGAAAALVDWNGSEVSRLRAYSVVIGVLQRELSRDALEAVCSHVESGAPSSIAA